MALPVFTTPGPRQLNAHSLTLSSERITPPFLFRISHSLVTLAKCQAGMRVCQTHSPFITLSQKWPTGMSLTSVQCSGFTLGQEPEVPCSAVVSAVITDIVKVAEKYISLNQ